MIGAAFMRLLFPPKCVLCQKLLSAQESDLCHDCRINAPEYVKSKNRFSFVAGWTALWYYKDKARQSILRYKFRGYRSYAAVYGRLLAMHLLRQDEVFFDLIGWVPVSRRRKWLRGFDQVELIAKAVARELGTEAVCVLKKIRHTPPQSGIGRAERRRANVLGAYRAADPDRIAGKHILLIDDIITTGATICECAKVLQLSGAASVYCAAIAAAYYEKKKS